MAGCNSTLVHQPASTRIDSHFHLAFATCNVRLQRNSAQVEGSFSQPNGGVCQQMLTWAQSASRDAGGDLLELYCGNANFTIPLAANFKQVRGLCCLAAAP